jgi:hypothetical protein
MKPKKVLNSKGEPIVLDERAQRVADINQRFCNALGYQIDITTLTTIIASVSEQKFFQVAPADYLPVRVGQGAWSLSLTTFRSFLLGDEFEKGIINQGTSGARLAETGVGIDALSVSVRNWAKEITYTLFDIEFAQKSGNWDMVTALEKARKTNWDLGIQKIAFLGAKGDSAVRGFLNQTGVTVNTSTITKPISTMTSAELKTFLTAVIADYRANCNYTAWPTHFTIPEDDYLGLASQASADFPIKSTLQVLRESFAEITGKPDFKIQPLAYAIPSKSSGVLTVPRYVLSNYDEDSLRMDIPVDYTSTLANSMNSFSFQNVGYGQFTGVLAYRPAEMLYFDIV